MSPPNRFHPGLVSIVIPAFNQPQYLRRALQSIIEQSYRPIEVIVSDDASPKSLKPTVDEFRPYEDARLCFRFHRFETNQGMVENFHYGVSQAQGKYLLPMPHDNRFLYRDFLSEAVRRLQMTGSCFLCYANAIYERSGRPALHFPPSISFEDDWTILEGNRFISLYGNRGIGWSQVILMDHSAAILQGAFKEPFAVTGRLARELGIAQDDAFSYVLLLSAAGTVAIYRGFACEIGEPPESYSRFDFHWRATRRKTTFVNFYNIARADLRGPHAITVKRQAARLAYRYIDSILDQRIGRYYRWEPVILALMVLGFFRAIGRNARYRWKRFVNALRPGTFRKVTPE